MTLRELLQIEVWSKRTSRKILIVFAIVIAGFVTWFFVDKNWLTRGEREAARKALLQIDLLEQQSSEVEQKDFDAREQKVQQAVEAAEQAAWTTRDKQVSLALSWCLGAVGIDRGQERMDRLMQQRHIVLAKPDPEIETKMLHELPERKRLISMTLHSALYN